MSRTYWLGSNSDTRTSNSRNIATVQWRSAHRTPRTTGTLSNNVSQSNFQSTTLIYPDGMEITEDEVIEVIEFMEINGVPLTTFEEPEVQFNTGLSEEEIQNIATTYITKQHVEDKDTCTICCIDYDEGEVVNKLQCNHLYHKECITTWLRSNGTCPNCRKNLNTDN